MSLCLTERCAPSIPSYSLPTCSASPPKSLFYYKRFKADHLVFDLVTQSWAFCPKRMSFVTGSSQVYQILLKFSFWADSSILALQILQSTLRCRPLPLSHAVLRFHPAHSTLSKPGCATFCAFPCIAAHDAYSYKYLPASGYTRKEEGQPDYCILVPTVNFLPKSHKCLGHLGLSVIIWVATGFQSFHIPHLTSSKIFWILFLQVLFRQASGHLRLQACFCGRKEFL